MKKSIACFALLACLGLTVYAAPQEAAAPGTAAQSPAPRFDPNRQVQRMAKRLNLTADQQQQLLPVLAERSQEMQAIRNDSSLSAKDRRAKIVALREDTEGKIKALLTADQKNAYDQMIQQAREHRRDKKSQNIGSGVSSH